MSYFIRICLLATSILMIELSVNAEDQPPQDHDPARNVELDYSKDHSVKGIRTLRYKLDNEHVEQ